MNRAKIREFFLGAAERATTLLARARPSTPKEEVQFLREVLLIGYLDLEREQLTAAETEEATKLWAKHAAGRNVEPEAVPDICRQLADLAVEPTSGP